MIHYHGLPITPASAAYAAVRGGHAFVSFRHPDQLPIAVEACQSFALDNGAYSLWRSGEPAGDWSDYISWVRSIRRIPGFDFAVIPDVIGGTEQENDRLVDSWPLGPHDGAPVWHLHESIGRLIRLATYWPRLCLGSSGDFSVVGSKPWWNRMIEAMNAVCDDNGHPTCKLHGLRMLDPEIYRHFPFASADSTNIGRNVGIDSKWKGTYTTQNKDLRALIMRDRIEAQQSATTWRRRSVQTELAGTECSELFT